MLEITIGLRAYLFPDSKKEKDADTSGVQASNSTDSKGKEASA